MPNRPATWLSAIFAGVLAAMLPATLSYGATPAAKDCPSGPKVPASRGGHWYYHIDHATGRHCWYLGQEHDKLSQPAAPSARGQPASPEAEAALQPSIADAHAELQGPSASAGRNPVDAPTPVMLANAAVGGDGGAPRTPGAEMLQSLVASRWPDSLGVSSSAGRGPAPANAVAATPANSTAAVPVVAAVSNAAADAASETPSVSVRLLTIAMAGALLLAGVIALAFVPSRGTGGSETAGDRRTIRFAAGAGAQEPPAPSDADDRIAEMLALLSGGGRR